MDSERREVEREPAVLDTEWVDEGVRALQSVDVERGVAEVGPLVGEVDAGRSGDEVIDRVAASAPVDVEPQVRTRPAVQRPHLRKGLGPKTGRVLALRAGSARDGRITSELTQGDLPRLAHLAVEALWLLRHANGNHGASSSMRCPT